MICKLPFLKQFNAKTSAQQGRSMVEILGVLAVMGVLSAGGIYGYSFAMDKYRANDIVYEVNLRANDIWHKYQEMPLPEPSEDGTDFDEFPDMTGTGYPIYMTSHPDVAFKTYVEGVSSRVCKNVVNMNLNGVIQGIQFVQVNGEKYVGSASICGEDETDNTIVFTSFLDSESNADGEGQSGDPCVEDGDCLNLCGTATCDIDKMTCKNSCTGTDTPFCLDDGESGICVECITNKDCESKGRSYICNEETYTCTTLQKTCPSGTFRTQNGACIECNNGNNFIVLKDGHPFPDTSDEVDGYTMCQQCASDTAGEYKYERQYGVLVDDEQLGYCSYMCTAGYSYQSLKKGCVSCDDETPNFIAKDDVSKQQCLSCPNRAWYGEYWFNYYHDAIVCQNQVKCADDEFVTTVRASHYTCAKCSSSRNQNVGIGHYVYGNSDSQFYQYRVDKCNNCPERDSNGNYSARWHVGNKNSGECAPKCEQPPANSEEDTICLTNPTSDKCKRKWQNSSGACFDCRVITSNNKIIYPTSGASQTDAELKRLCLACGRQVKDSFCILPQTKETCGIGQFLGKDGICYPCDQANHIEIESDAVSGCVANCKKNTVSDTTYNADGTVDTRHVYTVNETNYCALTCKNNYINDSSGQCVSCGNDKSLNALTPAVLSDCNKCTYRQIYNSTCAPRNCPTSYYLTLRGECYSCNDPNPEQATWTNFIIASPDSCHVCENRLAIKRFQTDSENNFCTYVNPGSFGICNSKGNGVLHENLNDTIVSKAQPYIRSTDNNDGQKFRDHYGLCRSCSDNLDYRSDEEQCLTCQNRRWQNNTCMKGLCETGLQFLSGSSCLACSNVNKPIDPTRENLCSSCSNRRQLEIGTPETTWSGLCVEECAGLQWQDINGNCLSCSEGGERQIGTDAESRRLCNECDGLRESQPIYGGTEGAEVIGYKCVLK